jgi:DnaK suppressor protein
VSPSARSAKETAAKTAVAKTGVAKTGVAKAVRVAKTGVAKAVRVAKETAAKPAAAKPATAKETAAKETVVKETAAKHSAAKETVAKETVVKEPLAKETAAKETVAKGTKAPAKVVAKEVTAGTAPVGRVGDGLAEAPKVKRAHPPAKKTDAADGAGRGTDHGENRELFLEHQRGLLMAERRNYTRQAEELRAQAEALALEHEPGDVQFDEEGGEGGTANVDRELDLHLSAQAQAAIEEIDAALDKITAGTYGFCESCGSPVPKARLEALPHARLCVSCKSGGLSARRQ